MSPDMDVGRFNESVAQGVVRALIRRGARHAVVSPGSRNTPILLALAAANVELHVVLDERSAAFFALGLAKATGVPTVLSCTSGSAGANYLPAIVEAHHSNHGLFVITADRPAELHGRGAPQTMNQRELFGVFAQRFENLSAPTVARDADHAERVAAALFDDAYASGGPVHLNMAFREPLWCGAPLNPVDIPAEARPIIAASPLESTETQALSATRGLIICGPETARGDAERAVILEAAKRLEWPVLAEAGSGVRFGGQHSHLITTYDAILRSAGGDELTPDVVVRFGKTSTSRPLNEWLSRTAQRKLLLVSRSSIPADPDRLMMAHVHRSAAEFSRLAMELPSSHDRGREWVRHWQDAERTLTELIIDATESHWWEGSIARAVLNALPEGAAIHLANSMPIRDVDSFCGAGGRTIAAFTNRGVNGIDGTIATAAGEAHGRGGGPFTLLIGDLAFLHDASSLKLAGQRMTIVVVDNGGGGIFGFLPIAEHPREFESLFVTQQEADPLKVARGYGARVTQVSSLEALSDAVTADSEREGVSVIVAQVSRPENLELHRRFWAQAQDLLEANL
jgi:2-succinyl-5-enolpyruvyl-6-hydroxy-3-cyclohexene-1-carboxylate synthase